MRVPLGSKALAVIIAVVIVGVAAAMVLPDYVVNLMYSPPKVDVLGLRVVGKSGGMLLINVTVKAVNTAGIGVDLRKATVTISYGGEEVGRGVYEGRVPLPPNRPVVLSVNVSVDASSRAFNALLDELWREGSAEVGYSGRAYVEASISGLTVGREVPISGSVTIKLSDFIPKIGWRVEFLNLSDAGSEGGRLYVNATIRAVSLTSEEVVVRRAVFDVYYKGVKVGSGVLNREFTLHENEAKNLTVKVFISTSGDVSGLVTQLINEALAKGAAKLTYNATVTVYLPRYLISKDVALSGSTEFHLWDPTKNIEIRAIYASRNGVSVLVSFRNKISVPFNVSEADAHLFFGDRDIGSVSLPRVVMVPPGGSVLTNVTVDLSSQWGGEVIKELLTRGNITVYIRGRVKIGLFGLSAWVNISLHRSVAFSFSFTGRMGSFRYLGTPRMFRVSATATVNMSSGFVAEAKLSSARFNVYVDGKYVGVGTLAEPAVLRPGSPTPLEIDLELSPEGVQVVANKVLGNETINAVIKEITLTVEIAGVKVTADVPNTASLSIRVPGPRVYANATITDIEVTRSYLIIRGEAHVKLLNYGEIPVSVKDISFGVYDDEGLVALAKVPVELSIRGEASANIRVYVFLRDGAQRVATKFFTQPEVRLKLRDIKVYLKLFGEAFSSSIAQEVNVTITSKINIRVDVQIKGIGAKRPGVFTVNVALKATVERVKATGYKLVNASFDLYSGDRFLGSGYAEVGKTVYSRSFTVDTEAAVAVSGDQASWLAQKLLNGERIVFTARNITVGVEAGGVFLYVPVPPVSGAVSYKPEISIDVYSFTIRPPGNVIDGVAALKAEGVSLKANLTSLDADLVLYPDNVSIATVKFLSAKAPVEDEVLRGSFRMKFDWSYVQKLADILSSDKVFRIFGHNVKVRAVINGLPVTINMDKTFLIKVKVHFKVDYEFEVLDFSVKPPGNIAVIDVKATFDLTGGPNAPVNIIEGRFSVHSSSGPVGTGSFTMNRVIEAQHATVRVRATLHYTSEGAGWMATQLVSYGRLPVNVVGLRVHVKIYDLDLWYSLPPKSYVYVTEPIKIEVLDVRLTSLTIAPPHAEAVADVKVTNPFNFSVTIVPREPGKPSMEFDVYCSDHGTYLGHGKYYGNFTVGPHASYVITSIPVEITNPTHIVLYHYDGSKVRMYVDVKNGVAGAKLYETKFTFHFERHRIYVEWP